MGCKILWNENIFQFHITFIWFLQKRNIYSGSETYDFSWWHLPHEMHYLWHILLSEEKLYNPHWLIKKLQSYVCCKKNGLWSGSWTFPLIVSTYRPQSMSTLLLDYWCFWAFSLGPWFIYKQHSLQPVLQQLPKVNIWLFLNHGILGFLA